MTATKKWTTCRCCRSADLTPLFSLGEQWVSDFPVPAANVMAKDFVRENPCAFRREVEIALDLCNRCTLVQQRFTAPQDFLYTRHYWYRSGTTDTMRRQLEDVVRAAWDASTTTLANGDVWLDIGANDGTLLSSVGERYPGVVRVGVEPASNLADECRKHCDVFVGDFWSAKVYFVKAAIESQRVKAGLNDFGTKLAKVVTACGMFYDLDDPNAFVRDVAAVLHPDGVFVAQLQCLAQTVRLGDVGNLAHEHLEFYSLESLLALFGRHGLQVYRVEENAVNGGSYRLYARHARGQLQERSVTEFLRAETLEGLADPMRYARLYRQFEVQRTACRMFVRTARDEGKKVWVYGASTKGNVILQYYGLGPDEIVAAADRSPEKWGRTTSNGVPIVSEDEFRKAAPDYALVLPYSFINEFKEREAAWLRGGGRFLVPLPEFRVVGGV